MVEKGLLKLDLGHNDRARPKHERLRKHLVGEMLAGRLRPGEALPSELRLVEVLGLARTTVRQAMASLENDGLIRRVPGKGTFVDSDVRRKLKHGLDIFALVVPETREGFYPALLHGFETAASDIHHQTIICNTDEDVGRQADIILQLLATKVGGVAINPTSVPPTPAYHVSQLQERGIPVVFCHRGVEGIRAPVLALPFHKIGQMAGKVLMEHGHRRVAFFASLQSSSSALRVYEEGFREAMRTGGSDTSAESVYVEWQPIKVREESCWAALQQVFAKPDPPTAIFASNDILAELIYLLLPRLGLRVPEDVSLVGFGGAWRTTALARRLTCVVVDEAATGQKAVSLLHEMRRGDRPIDDNTEIALELALSEGETLAAPARTIS